MTIKKVLVHDFRSGNLFNFKEEIVEFKCNCCNKVMDSTLEIAECLHWESISGYGSKVFGDGTKLSLSLCEECLDKLVGAYIIRD